MRIDSVYENLAGARFDKTWNRADDRGLAGSTRTGEGGQLAGAEFERDIADHRHRVVISDRDPTQLDARDGSGIDIATLRLIFF